MTVLVFDTLTVTSWVFAGLAVVLTGGRFWIRCTIIKRLSWDDATHLLALLLLLAQVGIVYSATSMMSHLTDEDREDVSFFIRLDVAGVIVTWSCLYAVKVSFLLLYRRIFQISERFMRAWWIVLAIVVLTFWPLIAGFLTECGNPSALGHVDRCETHSALRRQKIYIIYSCTLNVFSDLAIMALPLAMLKDLQMRTMAKFGLAGVFCCAFITIAFDILRAVQTITKGDIAGSTALWTNLESAIAVIVSCLPSFAALFRPRNNRNVGRPAGPYRPRSMAIADSAKIYMTAESSIKSGDEGVVAGALSCQKASPDTSFLTDVHTMGDLSPRKGPAV